MQRIDGNFSAYSDFAHYLIDVMEMACLNMSTVIDLTSEDSDHMQPVDMELTYNVPPVSTSSQQVMVSPSLVFITDTVVILFCNPG